jgi:hypothetical protein
MPAEHTVPNTNNFDFQTVSLAVWNDANAGRNLVDTIAMAKNYIWKTDESYRGSMNSLLNFRNYRSPIASISPNSYTWNYNDITTQTFVVTTNKTHWHFTPASSYENWNIHVYDSTNSILRTGGIFYSGDIVRVAPMGNNLSGSYSYAYLCVGDDLGYQYVDCTYVATQNYYGAMASPIVVISCDDGTMTLSNIDSVLAVASNELWIQFAPNNMFPSSGSPVYVTVTKLGPVWLGSHTFIHCYNNSIISTWITLNEVAIEGTYYYVYLSTSNA